MRDWGKFLPILALLAVGLFAAAPAAAQTGSVTGTILDAGTGAALDAVQISLETVGTTGSNLGGLTQATGRFLIINVPVGQYVLRAQLLGFGTLTQVVDVTAGQAAVVNLRLEPQAISLSEIVVTGVAGATQRTKLPFDVAQVRVADLPVPSMNAAQSLAGKVAGAQVVSGSGRPGSTPSILLRGVTSLDNSGRSQEPLYIVDGVILGSSLVDLDALDIQSIEIVKGAAAASLYGSRAANGVINIRTKRGAEMADDQVRYSVRTEYGQSGLASNAPDLLTGVHEFALTPDGTMFIDGDGTPCAWLACASPSLAGQTAGGGTKNEWNTYQLNKWPGKTYDQVARFFEGGAFMQNSVTAEGRSGKTNFHVSANNLQEQGILRFQPGYNRTNFRVNVDQAVVENLTIQTSVFYSRSKNATSQGNLFDLTRMPAGVDLLADDPNLPGNMVLDVNPTNAESENALYSLRFTDSYNWRSRFLGSATTRYSPTNWLKVDGTVSFDRSDSESETFREKGYRTIRVSPSTNNGTLSKSESTNEALNASITASLVWDPTDRIHNTTQGRYLYEQEDYTAFNTSGYSFAVAHVPTFDNIDPESVTSGSSLQTVRSDGYFFITNFDIYDKYVVDALIRNDGSSLFGEDERRQWYYRLAGAWRVSQEDWFNIPHLDEFKLRYSLGTAGGRPRFSAQYETYSVSGGRISPVNLGNKDLKPEFSTEHEAGIDMSFFDYKAILSLTYAQTTTEDQILQVPQPGFTGFRTQWRNAGTLESRTYEATLDFRLLERPNLSWSAKLLYDNTVSKITALDVPAYTYGSGGEGSNAFYARAGEEIGNFYGVHYATSCASLPSAVPCDGFAVDSNGWLVWVGNGGSLSSPQWGADGPAVLGRALKWGTPFQGVCTDRVTQEETMYCMVGNTIPEYNLGLASTLNWRGVSVYALLSRSSGFDIYNEPLQWGTFRRLTQMFDQTKVPEAEQRPVGYYDALYGVSGLQSSNVFVEDGSFTKLREVAISYRLSSDLTNRIPGLSRISSIGLNLVGRNLYTWTDYRGYDPDLGEGGGDTGSAAVARVDGYNYPNFRSFTAAIEFIF